MDDDEERDGCETAEHAFAEILQQLRVIQTGVQILSAFLLTLPFTVRFGHVTGPQKCVYVLSVAAATVAVALVIAPVSCRQRVGRDTSALVRVSAKLAQAGMLALLIAVVASVWLALDIATEAAWASGLTAVLTVTYGGLWYLLPARMSHDEPSRQA